MGWRSRFIWRGTLNTETRRLTVRVANNAGQTDVFLDKDVLDAHEGWVHFAYTWSDQLQERARWKSGGYMSCNQSVLRPFQYM